MPAEVAFAGDNSAVSVMCITLQLRLYHADHAQLVLAALGLVAPLKVAQQPSIHSNP